MEPERSLAGSFSTGSVGAKKKPATGIAYRPRAHNARIPQAGPDLAPGMVAAENRVALTELKQLSAMRQLPGSELDERSICLKNTRQCLT
jgi:hypothetical protein